MQGLRTDDDIHVRGAFVNRFPFLARDAAADADQDVRACRLDPLPAAELMEDLLLGFFPDRAGVQ